MSKNQGRELLTPEERERFTRIPPDISEWELGASFTLTPYWVDLGSFHVR